MQVITVAFMRKLKTSFNIANRCTEIAVFYESAKVN